METVKALLENTKHDLEMKLWWAEEHDKEAEFIEEIPKIKKKIADINEALFRFFSVSQRTFTPTCAEVEDVDQKLFNFMFEERDITLLDSEIHEIKLICEEGQSEQLVCHYEQKRLHVNDGKCAKCNNYEHNHNAN